MIRNVVLAAFVIVLATPVFAQMAVPPPPSPVPVPTMSPIRTINGACTAIRCEVRCKKGEIIASAVCNNHRSIGGPLDGKQPGPEVMPRYLGQYTAVCEAQTSPGFGDSMVAICIREDMLNR